jgi:uncharacterized LabA/DUF88 family protein
LQWVDFLFRNRAWQGLPRPCPPASLWILQSSGIVTIAKGVSVTYISSINPVWFAQRTPQAPACGVLVYWGSRVPAVPVNFYVDGFNLYHALLRFRDPKVEWLDLAKLCHRLILPKTERIQAIKYFSAYAHWLPDPMERHQEYVKALEATGVIALMGHFKNKDRECKACGAQWVAHEEKETDVSIGITMLNDAYKGQYERAYLITRDSDLMPAIKMVRTEFPEKQIVAVAPPLMGHSNDLLTLCQAKKKITPKQVWGCLLPREVKKPGGTTAAIRPAKYN